MITTPAPEPSPLSVAEAVARFDPEGQGFAPDRGGWRRSDDRGDLVITPLAWHHAHLPGGDALALLVDLQRETWGMPPEEVLPANLLAVVPDTGGSVLVAYDPARGFTPNGWLGFAIALGARSGVLVSHMLGVRADHRGTSGIGHALKLVQGFEALRTGHTAATWTFDPLRGANARLNLEKLGAVADLYTVDKYGALRTTLYGDVPSDRLTARWELTSPRVARRLRPSPDDAKTSGDPTIEGIPAVTADTLADTLATLPTRLRYRIPGDIDVLARTNPVAAIRWREETRAILSVLLPSSRSRVDPSAPNDPQAVRIRHSPGSYLIDGFSTQPAAGGRRESFYLLRRHDLDQDPSETSA